jgi:hypothetical protein
MMSKGTLPLSTTRKNKSNFLEKEFAAVLKWFYT